jgi:hypothetical protein
MDASADNPQVANPTPDNPAPDNRAAAHRASDAEHRATPVASAEILLEDPVVCLQADKIKTPKIKTLKIKTMGALRTARLPLLVRKTRLSSARMSEADRAASKANAVTNAAKNEKTKKATTSSTNRLSSRARKRTASFRVVRDQNASRGISRRTLGVAPRAKDTPQHSTLLSTSRP